MDRLERARRKHNAEVALLNRMRDKREQMLAAFVRQEKRIDLQIRVVTRSSKRIDKLDRMTIATHNAGPTASVVPALIAAVADKPVAVPLNDKVPTFREKKPTSAEHRTEAGPPPAPTGPARASDGAEPKPKRRSRRTPDDFRAEMESRKSAD
jgi:hypothetical protein